MNFTQTLTYWYSINKRDLPWRRTKNPYHIWLSEIIMQQTQIVQGLPYYEAFVKQYPTVFDLAKANEEDILKLWQGLGYYSRARNLHFTAKFVVTDLKGNFPKDYGSLLKLKGIGDYTASAIASICYDEQSAVVDGNVYRVLSRYFGINTPINSSKGIKYFKELAQTLLPKQDVGNYNQAIMDFGARQCKPKSPDCSICSLNTGCVALKNNQVSDLPVKINKTKITKKHFNFIVFISEDNKTILEKRTKNGIWKNLYQFPLIETKKRISLDDFIINENFKILIGEKIYGITLFNEEEIVHKLSHQHLYTSFWIVNVDELSHDSIATSRIHDFPVPILINRFIEAFGL
ncbi:MAG: A/G-specific adenine glycosylase [Bacteroidetes bacterium]|nr:MAG: A/G-specific adenine glycosylase [Bacteroidota bacterium]